MTSAASALRSRRSCPRSHLAAALIATCTSCAATPPAAAREDVRSIEVSGSAMVRVEPDLALVAVGVEVAGVKSVEIARDRAAKSMTAMVAELDRAGVAEADRQTTGLRIQPEYDYRDRRRQLRGYTASHTLEVRIKDLERLSALIDATLRAGGDDARLMGVTFARSDRDEAEARARMQAVSQAQQRAQQLAEAAGVRLGGVLHIIESGGPPGPRPPMAGRAMMAAEAAETPVVPGRIEIRVTVHTRWSIE